MVKIKEDCGVFGVFSTEQVEAAALSYYGLFALQHRGQEGCGICVGDDGVIRSHKDLGLVNDVFTEDKLKFLGNGNIAVGHVRYGTTGGNDRANVQPIEVKHIKGSMAIAHNGNLTNASELRRELELKGSIFHSTSDTEIIAYIITQERLSAPSIEEAVNRTMKRIDGAYSLCIMSPAKLVIARDKRGMRPLCYGRKADGTYIAASESCALAAVGAEFIRDVKPGEIVVFTRDGVKSIEDNCTEDEHAMCIFEYIYFARNDSVIDSVSVQKARIRAGEFLAKSHPVDADIVIGVPDSGLDAAIGYAKESGIEYGIGYVKNKYIGRTFIENGQTLRENKVRIKLSAVENTVRGKRVVMVDDSIVRGTTSRQIIQLLRDAGATEVHVRISSPPFMNPCYYGTDVDSRENLIACQHSIEEIKDVIGADSLGYLSIEDAAGIASDSALSGFCDACFSGDYPTKIPDVSYKNRFERKLSERDK